MRDVVRMLIDTAAIFLPRIYTAILRFREPVRGGFLGAEFASSHETAFTMSDVESDLVRA